MNNKPIIFLFELLGNKYLYDKNTNQIYCINEKIYIDIKEYIKNYDELSLNNCSDELKFLFSKGILLPNKLKKIEHPMTNYLEDILSNHISSMTLQVTQNCNMKCRYCSYSGDGILDRKRNSNFMTFDTAKKAIDFLYNKSIENDYVTIAFYGGEPLLQFKLIKEVVEYANKKFVGKNISYAITTNGTIMNKEIINLLKKNNFVTTISLDGNKENHNRNRRMLYDGSGSFEKVINNLNFIKKYDYEYYKKITINSVIERDLLIDDTISFFSNDELLKENSIVVNEVYDGRINLSYPKTNDYIASRELYILNALIKNYIYNQTINIKVDEISSLNKVSKIFENNSGLGNVNHPAGVCIPGLNKMIVDYKGNIRICEKVSEIAEDYIIGNLDDGFYINKIKKLLNIGQITESSCVNCWAFNFCNQCVATISDFGELNKTDKLKICENTKKEAVRKLENYIIIREVQKL